MSRLANTIMENRAFNKHGTAAMVNPTQGGQFGHAPEYQSYVSSAAYVGRNLIAILIDAPRGFQDLEDPQHWVSTLKNLVELSAKSIDGLKGTLSVEHIETPFGGAGEVQQDISNVTRERSAPVFTWTEKYGKAVSAFLNGWVLNLIMDPETKYPRVVKNAKKPVDLLPDYTGMTVLFLEPDPTHTKVITAWLSTNMRPTGQVAEISGKRDLTAPGEGKEYPVEFTALTQVGEGVNRFAQEMLDLMTLTGANPNLREAFVSTIDADVKAGDNGYAEQIDTAARSTIS